MAGIRQHDYEELIEILVKLHKSGKFKDIPNRVVEKSVQDVLKVYADQYNTILADTVNLLHSAVDGNKILTNAAEREIISKMQYRLKMLNDSIADTVEQDIVKSYMTGQISTAMSFLSEVSVEEIAEAVQYSLVNSHMVSNLVADTMEDLLAVTSHTERQVKKVIRSTFSEAMQLQAMKGQNKGLTAKMLEDRLSRWGIQNKLYEDGFIGIVDKAGRQWKLKTYVDMAVRTKTHQAYVQGVKDKTKDYDTDVAKIPIRNSKDPCKNFEGMLISMNGITKGYPTYDQLKSTGLIFHPNCKHSPMAVGDIAMLHYLDIQQHKKQMGKLNDVMEEYKAKQKAKAKETAPKVKKGRPSKKVNPNQVSFF